MKLNRKEVIEAIGFLKPAITTTERVELGNHMQVQFDDGKAIFSALDIYIGKRVTLVEAVLPEKIETKVLLSGADGMEHDITKLLDTFLIPKATVEAFETLCKKHKAKLKKAAERDPEMGIIEITANELISYTDTIEYKQPIGLGFIKLDDFLTDSKQAKAEFYANSGMLADVLKGFNKGKPVEFDLLGDNGPIYLHQNDQKYEAFCPLFQIKQAD